MPMNGARMERSIMDLEWIATAPTRAAIVRLDNTTAQARVGVGTPATARVIEDPE